MYDDDDNTYIGSFISLRIIRILLILALIGALVAAAVSFTSDSTAALESDYSSTRIAFIAIITAAICVSAVFFLLAMLSALEYFVFVITDILFAFMILILSIFAIIRETQISTTGYSNVSGYNRGSFAAAAAFGLIAFFLYLLSVALARKETYRERPFDSNYSGLGSPFQSYGPNMY